MMTQENEAPTVRKRPELTRWGWITLFALAVTAVAVAMNGLGGKTTGRPDRYRELGLVLNRSATVLDRFNRELSATRDPKKMAEAMDRLAGDWEDLSREMATVAARYPELKGAAEPPDELRPVLERVDAAGKGYQESQIYLADYIRDHPEAVDAIMSAFDHLTAVKDAAASASPLP